MFDVLALENWDEDSFYYDGYGFQRPLSDAWNGVEYLADGHQGQFTFKRSQGTEQVKLIIEIYTSVWAYPGVFINGYDLILFGGDYDSGLGQPVDTIEDLGEPREFSNQWGEVVTYNKTRHTWTFPSPLVIHEMLIDGAGGYSHGRPKAITGIKMSVPIIPLSSAFWTNFVGQSERSA